MNNIFENLDADCKKFFDACVELFPDFKKKVEDKLKEKNNAELLQEEQNLSADIEAVDQQVEALKKKYDSLLEIKSNLLKKREKVHKKWIAANPAIK